MKKHASTIQKKAALKNIKLKHKVIKNWISNGIPYLHDEDNLLVRDSEGEIVLDFFPVSLREFYAWSSVRNCAKTIKVTGVVKGTGTTTLDNYQDLKSEIIHDLNTLKQKSINQLRKENKSNTIDKIKSDLLLSEMQRQASEKRYAEMNSKYSKLASDLLKEKTAHAQTIDHLSDKINEQANEIKILNAKLSELRKSLNNVTSLKRLK